MTPPKKILTLFGTRPEVIKLAPVILQFVAKGHLFQTVNVTSAQHTDLLYPFVRLFGIRIDYDLQVMTPGQTPNEVCSRVLASLDPILAAEQPDLLIVQGDTTTSMAGALAAFHRRIPVGHVEAGLRSGNFYSPYPEEVNRRLVSRLATYHFAATPSNRNTLLSEGVPEESVFVTGNPVVDSLKAILRRASTNRDQIDALKATEGMKRIVLTTHRRESFGDMMIENLIVLRAFIERHEDTALIFPVHPNPAVVTPASTVLAGHPRIHLIQPMDYEDFIVLLSHAWLIVSDSGGIQEEAPSLEKPLLVLRENTERPEAVEAGVARLVGGSPKRLFFMLEDVHQNSHWAEKIRYVNNPFGQGDSGKRIVQIITKLFYPEVSYERCELSH
jgi:UDP-N-acetylglucosamine 2-epimerase (non-hydrolysing)